MAKRSLVYSIIFDGAKAAAGSRKVAQESKGLSKSLAGVKTSTLDVKEAMLKVERAQAGASRALKKYGAESIQARSATLRLERAEHNLTTAQGKLTHAQDQTNRSTHRLSGSLKTAAKYAAGAVAAYASISQVKDAVQVTEDLGKTTLTLHRSFGLTVKSASEWAAVAKARGAEGKALTMGFKALATASNNATNGSKAQVKAFKDLGISQRDLVKHGNDMEWMLQNVSDGFGKMEAGPRKAGLAAKLFGRTWIQIAPLIREGSKAMNEQLALAEKYGVTFNGKTIKSVQDLIKAQREQKLAVMGLQLALGTTLVPALTKVIITLNQLVLSFRRSWPDIRAALEPVVRGIGTAVSQTVGAVSGLIRKNREEIRAFGRAMSNVGTAIAAVFNAYLLPTIKRIIPALKQQMEGLGQTIRGVVRVISGILTLDFRRAWDGVKDIFSGSIKMMIGQLRAMTAPARQAVSMAGKAIGSGFRSAWRTAKDIVGDGIDGVIGVIRGAAKRVGSATGSVASAVTGAFRGLGSRILRGLGSAGDFAKTVANAVIQLLNDAIPNSLGPINLPDNPIPRVAKGGWIGMPGQAGQDTVPAMLGVGEAVLNRHQQVPVENALRATYGIGLDQLFAQVRRPHYLAEGGRVGHNRTYYRNRFGDKYRGFYLWAKYGTGRYDKSGKLDPLDGFGEHGGTLFADYKAQDYLLGSRPTSADRRRSRKYHTRFAQKWVDGDRYAEGGKADGGHNRTYYINRFGNAYRGFYLWARYGRGRYNKSGDLDPLEGFGENGGTLFADLKAQDYLRGPNPSSARKRLTNKFSSRFAKKWVHGDRFAQGGFVGARMSSGGLQGGAAKLGSWLSARGFRPTSTTDGKHAPRSYHYSGRALDYGNSVNDLSKLSRTLWPYRSQFEELFMPTWAPHGGLYHNGRRFSNSALQAQHQDHIHVAEAAGGFWPKMTTKGTKRWGNGKQYGATVFVDKQGYKGDKLYEYSNTWAELGDGKALGGMPYGARIRVTAANGKSLVLVKRDIGHGGGAIKGHRRAVDIHITALRRLGINDTNWSGVVTVEVLKGVDPRAKSDERKRNLAKQRRAQRRKIKRSADARREKNTTSLENFLSGNYIAARTTPDAEDDKTTSLAGYRYWRRKFASDLADWRSGKLTNPDVLETDQSKVDEWGGNVLASWPRPSGVGVGAFASGLKTPSEVQALWDANPTENSGTDMGGDAGTGNEPSGPTPQELEQQRLDELKAIRELLQAADERAKFIGNTADGALARAVTAVVSGQIGGQVGLGFASPSYTGNYARY